MTMQFVMNGLIAGCIYVVIAIGFSLIYRVVKFFHFAHGIIYTIGAYAGYSFSVLLGMNWLVSFCLSIAVAGLFGIAVDRLVYYPLRKRNASNLIFLLASFGIFIFFQNLIQLVYGAQIFAIRTSTVREGYHVLGATITDVQLVILAVSILLTILVWLLVQKTKLGKTMRAVSDDPMAANVVGINPEKIIMISFVIGSALAGIAGILISYETNIEPMMGFSAILKGIIASIIGGIGSIPGAVLGGYFLGLAENLGIWKISAGWKDAISFGILIVFLLIRPRGLLGSKSTKEIV